MVVEGAKGKAKANLGYGGFNQLYGGGWGNRLKLVKLPACAATTPERSECQGVTPVETDKNRREVRAFDADGLL